jgi:hypothetical protein
MVDVQPKPLTYGAATKPLAIASLNRRMMRSYSRMGRWPGMAVRRLSCSRSCQAVSFSIFQAAHSMSQSFFAVSNSETRGYQLQGLNWMVSWHHSSLNGILADEMVHSLLPPSYISLTSCPRVWVKPSKQSPASPTSNTTLALPAHI